MAASAGIQELGALAKDVRAVEFKQTLVPADEGRLPPMFGHVLKRPQRRRVYFYDTADLALSAESGLLLRARVTQGGDDDSTVKVRPAGLEPGAAWRAIDGVEIEFDVSAKGPMCSAKLDGSPERGEIEDVEAGKRAIGGLFSHRRQADLIQAYAPRGVRLDDLAVLGPVDARKWVFEDLPGFPYDLCVEEWSLPDTTRFIELSSKVKRDKAPDAQRAFQALLERIGVTLAGGQEQKTPRVLKFFADRLPA